MDNIVLDIDCYSQQGFARDSNRDFIGVFEFDSGVLMYLLDFSTRSSLNCGSFVEQLNDLISEYITHEIVANYKLFFKVFQKIIVDIKKSFKSGTASLIISFIEYGADSVWGYTVGDSRIGIMDEEISWISAVHTGANPFGESFTDAMKLNPDRHLLTRSLNMRKEYRPDFFQFDVAHNNRFIIASDGFWAELTSELQLNLLAKQQVQTEDDSTFIFIKDLISTTKVNYSVSCENCNYFDLTIKD